MTTDQKDKTKHTDATSMPSDTQRDPTTTAQAPTAGRTSLPVMLYARRHHGHTREPQACRAPIRISRVTALSEVPAHAGAWRRMYPQPTRSDAEPVSALLLTATVTESEQDSHAPKQMDVPTPPCLEQSG